MNSTIDPGLVLYLPFFEPDGSSFVSRDICQHRASVIGAAWQPDGRRFDGIDDYISLANHPRLNFGSGGFSLLWWLKREENWGAGVYNQLLSKVITHLEINPGWGLTRSGSGALIFQIRGSGDVALSSSSIINHPLHTWKQGGVTVTRNGSQAVINGYDDGRAQAPVVRTVNGSIDNSAPLLVFKGYQVMSGKTVIGEVTAFNRSLTPPEVMQYYLDSKWRYK